MHKGWQDTKGEWPKYERRLSRLFAKDDAQRSRAKYVTGISRLANSPRIMEVFDSDLRFNGVNNSRSVQFE